jgi:hypothetical protein
MMTYVSAHTKAIVVGRQIDRKIVGIPFQQESWPTIDRAWCTAARKRIEPTLCKEIITNPYFDKGT